MPVDDRPTDDHPAGTLSSRRSRKARLSDGGAEPGRNGSATIRGNATFLVIGATKHGSGWGSPNRPIEPSRCSEAWGRLPLNEARAAGAHTNHAGPGGPHSPESSPKSQVASAFGVRRRTTIMATAPTSSSPSELPTSPSATPPPVDGRPGLFGVGLPGSVGVGVTGSVGVGVGVGSPRNETRPASIVGSSGSVSLFTPDASDTAVRDLARG